MTYRYVTEEGCEVFATPAGGSVVKLNTNRRKFLVIGLPSLAALRDSIEEYALKVVEDRWDELMVPGRGASIYALQVTSHKLVAIQKAPVMKLAGENSFERFSLRVKAMSLDEQRAFMQPLKPKSISELMALYVEPYGVDGTGYRYLSEELARSDSAIEFFGRITDCLYSGIAESDYTLGTPKQGFHQARILEYLAMALAKGWLLFPFVAGQTGINEVRALMHRDCTRRYLNPRFAPPEAASLVDTIGRNLPGKTASRLLGKYIERLVVCSTYRDFSQSNNALFLRCLQLVDNGTVDAHRQMGYARRAYNALTLMQRAWHPEIPRQPEIVRERKKVSLDEFVSFEGAIEAHPHLIHWAQAFSVFVRANENTPASGVFRRTVCEEFLAFLSGKSDVPLRPELSERSLINDYTDRGRCYRNFLRAKDLGATACNIRLSEMSRFFGDLADRIVATHVGERRDKVWFPNPVDLKFDRFSEVYRAGTTRKSISASLMEEMRQILIEDDYAWPKQWANSWTHLVNGDTNELEYVWCPSAAICLYVLLSLPLRGLQARMLDSGEGDPEIFDFDTRRMVPNPAQLPVNGMLDPRRSEGFIQVMASGLVSDPELVGLWICVNKTSDFGYAIPWVSEALLTQLRYQREWIFRYSPHPSMQCIEESQGHRNTPVEWVQQQRRFYCLFRDPSAERIDDRSLPVSKQKLRQLWGRLCLELQLRRNRLAATAAQHIRLVKPGTETSMNPVATHDLHSLRVSGITDLLDRGVPLNIVSEYVAGHATYVMTLWYDAPSPGAVRRAMVQANQRAGDPYGPLPHLSEDEIDEMRPHLLSHPDFKDLYTGFDALSANVGLIHVRHSGICPGTRCEEGGLSDNGRIEPVPVGDRGPSCFQCRFWLTGPAFLLGQAIEGNQLILKIRKKIESLSTGRERIMDAEDAGDTRLAEILRGQGEVEERQLNNMLTEWWHRMRFYESSIGKLDAYRKARDEKEGKSHGKPIVLLKHHDWADANFGFDQGTELELKHFLSTCAEHLPRFADEQLSAHQDIELAVGKFLAINDERTLSNLFFKMNDAQRLTAANLTVELMLRATGSPLKASALLEGKETLASLPNLHRDLAVLFGEELRQAPLAECGRLGQAESL